MTTVLDILKFMDQVAPFHTAAEWDNVGLLIGTPTQKVENVLTCLTIDDDVVQEAVQGQVHLIVAHHPLPFRALRSITTAAPEQSRLLRLIENKIAVISAHTAFDNAENGINQFIAEQLSLESIAPIRSYQKQGKLVSEGRIGLFKNKVSATELRAKLQKVFSVSTLQFNAVEKPITRVAIVCGAGGELLDAALAQKADCFVTGELKYHDFIKANSYEISLNCVGHFASEWIGVQHLAKLLQKQFPISIKASAKESDPQFYTK